MVSIAVFGMACGLLQTQPPVPKLFFANGAFTAVMGKERHIRPIQKPPPAKQASTHSAIFRKDDVFVVWDARGLSIRKGKTVATTRLASGPTDPKLFDAADAAKNRLLLEYGGYSPQSAELRASRRFGSSAFFVVRWRRPDDEPWFDALYRVDLAAPKPAPVAMLRLQGRLARVLRGDSLPFVGGSMVMLDVEDHEWSVVRVNPANGTSKRTSVGATLEEAALASPSELAFVESTIDGTRILGKLNLASGRRANFAEVDGQLRLIDGRNPWIGAIREDTSYFLQNLDSGAKLKLEPNARFERCGSAVLVWVGGNTPTEAGLYDPLRWDRLATWKAPAKAKP